MSYRQLQVSDQVRINSKYVSHAGRNAVVIAVDDQDINLVRVQIVPWQGFELHHVMCNQPTECVTLHSDHLMVRHEPNGFIIDGRIDQVKLKGFEERQRQYKEEDVDDDETCEYDGWDREDLIERIKELNLELDEIKGNT